MVPDKFNMVDMEGIDILSSYEDIIPGLYQKLVESIAQCRYQCLYNWYFDSVLIPPTYVEMTVNQDTNDIWINGGVFVTSDDRLSLHLPSIETVSGAIVYITDALSRKVEELICYINPLQTGSGDPSPENIRPISGWTAVNVYRESLYDTDTHPTLTVNLEDTAGTVYGGTLNVVTGELTVDRVTHILTGSENFLNITNGNHRFGVFINNPDSSVSLGWEQCIDISSAGITNNAARLIMSHLKYSNIGTTFGAAYIGTDKSLVIWDRDNEFGSVSAFKVWLSEQYNSGLPLQVSYLIADPIEYQLTPQELVMLLGNNVIWHDANGDISVTYWKK